MQALFSDNSTIIITELIQSDIKFHLISTRSFRYELYPRFAPRGTAPQLHQRYIRSCVKHQIIIATLLSRYPRVIKLFLKSRLEFNQFYRFPRIASASDTYTRAIRYTRHVAVPQRHNYGRDKSSSARVHTYTRAHLNNGLHLRAGAN